MADGSDDIISVPAGRITELQTRIAYLERKLARSEGQRVRQERIDDINRRLIKHVGAKLEQALLLAEQGNRAKTDFLATMSHEIRSPLNIILGMGELLAETGLDETQRTYLTSLLASGRQLLEQLTNVLEFSRLESGKTAVHREPFSFDLLCSSLLAMMETLARNKGIEFRAVTPTTPLGDRLGDLPKIKQILFNVLSNALKFTDHGSITLHIEEVPDHDVPDMIRFQVADTGIGIPPDELDTVFERFSQSANGLAMHRGGAGLGLAICKKLVNQLGGTISVRSMLGHGATFYILLPLPAAPERARRQNPANEEPVDSSTLMALASIRLLLAEDVAGNVEVIRRYLASYDVEIKHARNGEEAVRLFGEQQFDIVLMDIKMPVIDGITAMYRINEMIRAGAGRPVPIIAVTAHAFPEQVLSYLKKGFSGVLTKPFTKSGLIKTIGDFLTFMPPPRQPGDDDNAEPAHTDHDQVPEVLAPLLDRVIETLESDIESLADLLLNGDIAQLKDTCHATKGLAGLYGLHECAGLLAGLEEQIGARPDSLDESCLTPLREYLRRLKGSRPGSDTLLQN
jgi:signal transduction histidine kinase/CheY-like chemotaxis protein/HPt (histidine-containing phosphotransfer) domain-containing protein